MPEIDKFKVTLQSTIREVMLCIQANAAGVALVLEGDRRLIATVTDGDIRTAILHGTDLDLPVERIVAGKVAVTAASGSSPAELLRLMRLHSVRQIPLLDAMGRVVDISLLADLVNEPDLGLSAVLMAGGRGLRLRPLTDSTPKPMLAVGNRPAMQRTLERMRDAGIRRVSVTTHYLPEVISKHFGDGAQFGLEIGYVREDEPLGTAGSLRLLEPPTCPVLVINGDVLTHVDIRAMYAFHLDSRAEMTVGVRRIEIPVPYGVVDIDGERIVKLTEKPRLQVFINAGVYLLSPSAYPLIPAGRRFDMTQLVELLLAQQLPVASFPIHEYWIDIGQHADYERAVDDEMKGTY